jgi:GntR family transcriptional regulator, transcriptional repressor for pyruvate dehydrogenase complex
MTTKNQTVVNSRRSVAHFAAEQISTVRTLADRVTEALMEKIANNELPAGAQLPSEQTMASSFGVSRTVIREAVSRLKSEGLIDSRQGRGAIVRIDRGDVPLRLDINVSDPMQSLLHIVELRVGLDAEIAALAAERRKRDQMTAIYRALADIDRASKAGRDAVAEDLTFHLSIAKASGNPLFPELIQFLGGLFFSATRLTRANEQRFEVLSERTRLEHQAIANAIDKRDIEGAAAAARTHVLNAAERFRAAGRDFWEAKRFEVAEQAGRAESRTSSKRNTEPTANTRRRANLA